MRNSRSFTAFALAILFLGVVFQTESHAQGMGMPLTMQGLDNTVLQSVASRSLGGLLFNRQGDASLMFSNPASLSTVKGIQFSVAGLQQYTDLSQTQQWYPQKYYPGFSLLMEGLMGFISNPDTTNRRQYFVSAKDTVQRPFDQIGPNWSHSRNKSLPVQVFAAIPFSVGETRVSAGVGFLQYANLSGYYQNNNVLTPSIGSQRPLPIILPPTSDSVHAYWYQYQQSRDGSIYGYGGVISAEILEGLTVGVSGMYLKGTTDDAETQVGRGRMSFVYSPQNFFVVDSVSSHVSTFGTSDFTGEEFTFSAEYRGRYITIGGAVKAPTTLTRKFQSRIVTDSMGAHSDVSVSGQDEMTLPWRGTVGFTIALKENLTLGFEYELRPLASAVYKDAAGLQSNPWLSASLMHIGVNYEASPWLSLRAGVRQQAAVFQEEGAPIAGEPISFSVYSAGVGITFDAFRFDVAYEYADMKYQDMYATNVNLNRQSTNSIVAGVSYEIQ
jgi:hypothetical protein